MSAKDEVRHAVRERNAAWQVRYAGDQAVLYGFLARENQPQRLRRRDRMICAYLLLATLPTVASIAIRRFCGPADGGQRTDSAHRSRRGQWYDLCPIRQ